MQRLTGAVAAPFDCFLVLRGIRSLLPRMKMHCDNALQVRAVLLWCVMAGIITPTRALGYVLQLAQALEIHPAVLAVHYPGLHSHPGHATAAREMQRGFGGMLSVRIIGGQPGAVAFTNALTIFIRATSLGGTESLVEHRRSVEGASSTSPDDLVRISVGLEDVADLIADSVAALGRVFSQFGGKTGTVSVESE